MRLLLNGLSCRPVANDSQSSWQPKHCISIHEEAVARFKLADRVSCKLFATTLVAVILGLVVALR